MFIYAPHLHILMSALFIHMRIHKFNICIHISDRDWNSELRLYKSALGVCPLSIKVCMYICIRVYMYVGRNVYMYICMYVYMYVLYISKNSG
jgi:hypothetical protein